MSTLNIHPIFVHFPIALLTVYAALEIVRVPILTRQHWYFYTKAVLLILGLLGGCAALLTGQMAEQGFAGTPTMALVHLHETYAQAALWVYGVLTVLYLIEWIRRSSAAAFSVLRSVLRMEEILFRTWVLIPGSLIGLILITITGALGGALVYGSDADPIVSLVYHLLYKH